jgi:hypothetical protein
MRIEALEGRALLTTFYVDNNLFLTADRDASGGLSSGDQVTFGNGQNYQQANLTYDAAAANGDAGTAFSSIGQALASPLVQAGDTIDVAGGTYTEGGLTIDKSLTLQGIGAVLLQSPTLGGPETTLTIADNPDNVTLENLNFTTTPNLSSGLLDNGGGTLNLIDISGSDEFGIRGVTNLNITRTTNAPESVGIGPYTVVTPGLTTFNLGSGATSDYSGVAGFQDSTLRHWTEFFFQVKNLSVSTGAGSDSLSVLPLANTTVTIDGGDPSPPALPGDALTVAGGNINDLSMTSDATGYSGTWTSSDAQPVYFSHIESLGPGAFDEKSQGFVATEGQSYSGTLLEFNDSTPNVPLANYTATINWGDGETSAGTVLAGGVYGSLAVASTHTYAEEGQYAVSVAISRPGTFNTALTATAGVSEPPPVGTGVTLSATEGQPIGTAASGTTSPNAVVATFVDSDIGTDNDGFSATIEWGDGSSSIGTIASGADDAGEWDVTGSHVYAEDGNYTITVMLSGAYLGLISSIASRAIVAEEPIVAIPQTLTGTVGVALGTRPDGGFGEVIASVQQSRPIENENYLASIDWGDGTTSNSYAYLDLSLTRDPQFDIYDVASVHTYAQAGTYAVKVAFLENGIAVATVTSTAAITGTPNDAFIANVYHDLLGRQVDTNGLLYWSGRLDAGLTRSQLVASVESSDEYRQDEVASLYQRYLHRAAEPSALDAGEKLLATGLSDEQLAAIVVSSDEYFALGGGSNDGFLSALFQDALGRPIDAGARAAFEQELNAGFTRGQIANFVFGSHEYHAELVQSIYHETLNRPADDAGDVFWADQLDRGATDEQVIAAIAASEEYFAKTE